MGVELILNAANVNLVAFNRFRTAAAAAGLLLDGQVFAIFVIVLAAAEAAVALAIFLNFYNNFATIDVETSTEPERMSVSRHGHSRTDDMTTTTDHDNHADARTPAPHRHAAAAGRLRHPRVRRQADGHAAGRVRRHGGDRRQLRLLAWSR